AAHGLLEDLSRTDLKLGIISAGLTSKQMEKVLRLGIDRFLDSSLIFITDQVGIAKSNAELYRLACSTAGVEPGASLHVGDHPLHDMDSAKKAGMITALHAGSGKYAPLKSVTEPDYRVADLGELRALLASEFSIPV
ncbi:MAG: HAD family hydrolase, partial [Planctomycetes bacterium]|nr:HAD family hydrolase [Planctomycetota bacterium]